MKKKLCLILTFIAIFVFSYDASISISYSADTNKYITQGLKEIHDQEFVDPNGNDDNVVSFLTKDFEVFDNRTNKEYINQINYQITTHFPADRPDNFIYLGIDATMDFMKDGKINIILSLTKGYIDGNFFSRHREYRVEDINNKCKKYFYQIWEVEGYMMNYDLPVERKELIKNYSFDQSDPNVEYEDYEKHLRFFLSICKDFIKKHNLKLKYKIPDEI